MLKALKQVFSLGGIRSAIQLLRFISGTGHRSSRPAAYIEELKKDSAFFKKELTENMNKVVRVLADFYQHVPREYVERYLLHIKKNHFNNPLATLYIEAELGAPKRQLEFVENLGNNGFDIKNKRILDIGCSNGALLLACLKAGATKVLGIDIDPNRLKSAESLLGKTKNKVELLQTDLLTQNLPSHYSEFEVIFITDVIEHVPEVPRLFAQVKKYLAEGKNSFAFISLFNKYSFSNILSEPHYGVPGMILLKREEALNLWSKVRGAYNSALEYECFDWFTFEEYQEIAKVHNLGIESFTAFNPELLPQDHKEKLGNFYEAVCLKLNEAKIEEEYKSLLLKAIDAYCSEFVKDHAAALKDFNSKLRLYLKYYAQPLNMIVRHKTN